MRNLFSLKRGAFVLIIFSYFFVFQIGLVEGIFDFEINYASLTGVIKEEEKPKQLFDITFVIQDSLMLNVSDLTTMVTFENFGTIPTSVEMTFIIQDEDKDQVYLEKHSIEVETVSIFIKKFEGIDLDFGKYTIYLRTLYNEDVEDIFLKEFEIRSKISKSGKQLFDIKFELDRRTIEKAEDLTARVMFESFGSEPTTVNMLFTFLDSNGEEVYSEKNNAIVETEKILTKKFSYLNLDKGDYTLVLTTLYNVNVEDEFREKFSIVGEKNYEWLNWLSFALNFLFLFVFVFLLRRIYPVKRRRNALARSFGRKKRK